MPKTLSIKLNEKNTKVKRADCIEAITLLYECFPHLDDRSNPELAKRIRKFFKKIKK